MQRRQWWLLGCVLLVYSDSDLLAPNLTACAKSLGLNDLEKDQLLGGGLSVGLFLVGAPAAFVIGVLADGFVPRLQLLSMILWIGGMGCVLSAMAQNYTQLFLCRSLTGVALAGAMPLTYALAADWFPHRKTLLFSRLDLMGSIGVLLGQTLAGWIGPTLGWRMPFLLVGIPMMIAAVAVWTILWKHEQQVNNHKKHSDTNTSSNNKKQNSYSCKQWSSLFRRPTYWLLLLQGIPGCVPWSVLGTFWPDYLHVNMGYPVEQATGIVLAFKAGVLCGIYGTGRLGQWLYQKSIRYPPMFMLVIGLVRIPLTLQLFNPSLASNNTLLVLLALGSGILAAPTGTLVRAMVSQITEPTQRGMAYASFVLTDDIGRGAGPVLVAHWITVYQGDRRPAFGQGIAQGWLWNSLLAGLTFFTAPRDAQHQRPTLPHQVHLTA